MQLYCFFRRPSLKTNLSPFPLFKWENHWSVVEEPWSKFEIFNLLNLNAGGKECSLVWGGGGPALCDFGSIFINHSLLELKIDIKTMCTSR